MRDDGKFILYNQVTYWSTDNAGTSGCRLVLEDDGALIIYKPAWTANEENAPAFTAELRGDTLRIGETLLPGMKLQSKDGRFALVYQTDGALVEYRRDGTVHWSTDTAGQTAGKVWINSYGTLQVKNASGAAVWVAGIDWYRGRTLRLTDSGLLTIEDRF